MHTPYDAWQQLANVRGDYVRPVPAEHAVCYVNGKPVRPFVEGLIHGILASKSNSRKIVTVRGRPMLIKEPAADVFCRHVSDAARAYQKWLRPPLTEMLWLTVVVWHKNMMRDLDIELLKDALQRAEVIDNDRSIWYQQAERRLDKDNPRVEFMIGRWK